MARGHTMSRAFKKVLTIYKVLVKQHSVTQNLSRRTIRGEDVLAAFKSTGMESASTETFRNLQGDYSQTPHSAGYSTPGGHGVPSTSKVSGPVIAVPKGSRPWPGNRQQALPKQHDCQAVNGESVARNELQDGSWALQMHKAGEFSGGDPMSQCQSGHKPYTPNTDRSVLAAHLRVKENVEKWTSFVSSSYHPDAQCLVKRAISQLNAIGGPIPAANKTFALKNYTMQRFFMAMFCERVLLRSGRKVVAGSTVENIEGNELFELFEQLESLPATLEQYRQVARRQKYTIVTSFVAGVFYNVMKNTDMQMEGIFTEAHFLGERNSKGAIKRETGPNMSDHCFYNLFYNLAKSVATYHALLRILESRATQSFPPRATTWNFPLW